MYLCIVLDIYLLLIYGSFVPCSPCRALGSLGSRAEDSIPVSWDHRKLVALLTWSEFNSPLKVKPSTILMGFNGGLMVV